MDADVFRDDKNNVFMNYYSDEYKKDPLIGPFIELCITPSKNPIERVIYWCELARCYPTNNGRNPLIQPFIDDVRRHF